MYRQVYLVVLVVISLNSSTLSEMSKKPNRFLTHIFNKYGSHGVINFEGLEHLMHNLGLGDLEFDPGHTVDQHRPEGFKVPDIDVEVDDEHAKRTETTDSIVLKTKEGNGASETNDVKVQTATANETSLPNETTHTEYLNAITWKSDDFEDASFASLHNPKHVHHKPHSHEHGGMSTLNKSCLSPSSMLRIVVNDQRGNDGGNQLNYRLHHDDTQIHHHRRRSESDEHSQENGSDDEFITNIKITPTMFLNMCPALLVQIEQGACSEVTKVELGKEDKAFTMAWIYATVSIAIISLCGLIGIAMVPLAKSIAYEEILRFLIALAVGTLCGDALMHLLPHALTPHVDHGTVTPLFTNGSAENDPVWLCFCGFMSALFMYSLEVLLPLLNGGKTHSHSHGHSHGHNHEQTNPAKYAVRDEDIEIVEMAPTKPPEESKELNKMLDDSNIQKKSTLSPVAFMVVIGDGLHNLTDGLAIGAAFGMDPVTGMATAFAVLCHELPHELGDFALLLQTGVSIKRAIFLNIVSSVLSVIGMIVGLVIAGIHTGFVRWIYAATAGTFLYIALADLVPELGRNVNEKTFKNSLLQISGILTGGIIMLAIGLNEDRLRILFE